MADGLSNSGIAQKTMSTFNLDDGTKYIIRDQDAQSKIEQLQTDLEGKLDKPTNAGAGTAGQVPVLQEDGTTLWGDMPKDIGVLTLPVSEYTGTDPYKKAIVYLNDIPLEYFKNRSYCALFTLQDQEVNSYRLNYRADDGTVKQIINYTPARGFLRISVTWEDTNHNSVIKYSITGINDNSTMQVDCTNHATSTDITASTSYNTQYLSINNTHEYTPTNDYCPATKKYVDDANAQADWNQNDEAAPDYVKNRPFYTGDPVENIFVEESTVSFAETGYGYYGGQIQSTFVPTVGETYKVNWDGADYECTCIESQGMLLLGDLNILFGMHDPADEPFLINARDGEKLGIITVDSSASHTFSVVSRESVAQVVKINPKYLPISFKPLGGSYLTFSSANNFTISVNNLSKNWDGTLEYFTSDGAWTVWDGTKPLVANANEGEYALYLRGIKNTVIVGSTISSWLLNGTDIKCIGNIENLLDYATVKSGGHPNMSNSCYSGMFKNCTSLTQAPALPATTLTDSCYNGMFTNCTSLTKAPALPATTLANHCYYLMFYGCTSLTQAPALPATTLADSCYSGMFKNCTSLTQAPALPATTLAYFCYDGMFENCTSLTQAPALPATTLANSCYSGMFENCTSLKLSSTKTDEYTQEYRIPSSGNGVTATNALHNMFSSTGGTFTGTPEINTTYYLSSDNMVVRETDTATLNGYVGSMINNAVPTSLSDLSDDETHRTVTDAEKEAWNAKVDKVEGKGLSTNDYTTEEKELLANLNTFVGDTAVSTQISIAIAEIPQPDWNEADETADSYIKNKPDPILNNTIDEDREDQASNGYSLSHVIEGDKHSFFNVKLDDTQSRIFHGYTVDSNNLRQVYSLTDANNAYLMTIGKKNGVKDVEAGFGRRNNAVQAYGMDTKFQWNLATTGTIAQGVVADKVGTKSARIQVESDKAILRAKNGSNLIDANALADSSTLNITGGSNTISMSVSDSGASITGLSAPVNDTDAANKAYVDNSTAQSDWNQNDEAAVDFVKNRPFYTGDLVEAEIADINALASSAGTNWQLNSSDPNVFVLYLASLGESIKIGEEYKIIVNENEYRYTAVDTSSIFGEGTIGFGDTDAFSNNDISSFNNLLISDGVNINIMCKIDTAPTSYKLYGQTQEIKKIDSKYLPNISADNIASGILPVEYGGTGQSAIVDTNYKTARYRASTLNASETTPTINGVINWTYE